MRAAELASLASLIDQACVNKSPEVLASTLEELRLQNRLTLFASAEPPLPLQRLLSTDGTKACADDLPLLAFSTDELQARTNLPLSAFAPDPERKRAAASTTQLSAAAAAVSLQVLLAVLAVRPDSASLLDTLRHLEGWQVPPLALGLTGGVTLVAATVDRLLLSERLLRSVGTHLLGNGAYLRAAARWRHLRGAPRRDALVRHEAAHMLLALLLGCPVEAVQTSFRTDRRFGGRAGTAFHAPALAKQQRGIIAEVDELGTASVVLMGGIAAEAMHYGVADGGTSDERALLEMCMHHNKAIFALTLDGLGDGGDGKCEHELDAAALARWGAANAVLMLRTYDVEYEALCAALRRDSSVGECCVCVERARRARVNKGDMHSYIA